MNESTAPCSCRDGGCPWWVRVGTHSSRTWKDARWTHPSVDWLCLELESGYSRIGLAFRLLSKVPHHCVDLKYHPLLAKLSYSLGKERQGPTIYMLGWRFCRQWNSYLQSNSPDITDEMQPEPQIILERFWKYLDKIN